MSKSKRKTGFKTSVAKDLYDAVYDMSAEAAVAMVGDLYHMGLLVAADEDILRVGSKEEVEAVCKGYKALGDTVAMMAYDIYGEYFSESMKHVFGDNETGNSNLS